MDKKRKLNIIDDKINTDIEIISIINHDNESEVDFRKAPDQVLKFIILEQQKIISQLSFENKDIIKQYCQFKNRVHLDLFYYKCSYCLEMIKANDMRYHCEKEDIIFCVNCYNKSDRFLVERIAKKVHINTERVTINLDC